MKNFFYRVYYEDTDAGGVVYYANYLKFYERARTDFLRNFQINQSKLAQELNIIFVVRSCNIQYIMPARLDDLLEVSLIVKEIKSASIEMYQEIKKDDLVISNLNVSLVCVDSNNFKPKKIPQNIKSLLNV